MWDNNAWVYFYDNTSEGEPPFLIQDFIHAVQPDARFIVMLRDPVERWEESQPQCSPLRLFESATDDSERKHTPVYSADTDHYTSGLIET